MHPGYVTELQSVLAGVPHRPDDRLEPGQVVRVSAPGRYLGVTGPIVKRGRTCYHVRFRGGVLPRAVLARRAGRGRRLSAGTWHG